MLAAALIQISGILILLGIGAHILDLFDLQFRLMRLIGMENSQGWILAIIGLAVGILSILVQAIASSGNE